MTIWTSDAACPMNASPFFRTFPLPIDRSGGRKPSSSSSGCSPFINPTIPIIRRDSRGQSNRPYHPSRQSVSQSVRRLIDASLFHPVSHIDPTRITVRSGYVVGPTRNTNPVRKIPLIWSTVLTNEMHHEAEWIIGQLLTIVLNNGIPGLPYIWDHVGGPHCTLISDLDHS